ncbi:GntR family transcriptional regulator [Streptomyces buecherae]|uniref:GntR family transcriptional regulator n=1 Tax=Streptomyces buecherae TaxID=2763006 RepID=UPI0033D12EDA
MGPDVLARPVDQLGGWAHEVHTLLETVRDAQRAGQVTAAVVGQNIAARVQDGEYYPGCVLSSYRIALDYGLPQAVADDAVQDLLACGVLESSGGRAAPAGSRAAREHMEKVITDRLRAQIAAGLYPPHSTLPSRRELAQVLWSVLAHVTGALRTLAGEGLVTTGPGPVQVTAAAADLPPAPQDAPPPCALVYNSAAITRQTQEAIDRWRLRRPAPPAVVEESWAGLRQMTVQLLRPSAPGSAVVVRRAVEVVRAPWPDSSWERVWHTACLARTVAALRHHVDQLDRSSTAARSPE